MIFTSLLPLIFVVTLTAFKYSLRFSLLFVSTWTLFTSLFSLLFVLALKLFDFHFASLFVSPQFTLCPFQQLFNISFASFLASLTPFKFSNYFTFHFFSLDCRIHFIFQSTYLELCFFCVSLYHFYVICLTSTQTSCDFLLCFSHFFQYIEILRIIVWSFIVSLTLTTATDCHFFLRSNEMLFASLLAPLLISFQFSQCFFRSVVDLTPCLSSFLLDSPQLNLVVSEDTESENLNRLFPLLFYNFNWHKYKKAH